MSGLGSGPPVCRDLYAVVRLLASEVSGGSVYTTERGKHCTSDFQLPASPRHQGSGPLRTQLVRFPRCGEQFCERWQKQSWCVRLHNQNTEQFHHLHLVPPSYRSVPRPSGVACTRTPGRWNHTASSVQQREPETQPRGMLMECCVELRCAAVGQLLYPVTS